MKSINHNNEWNNDILSRTNSFSRHITRIYIKPMKSINNNNEGRMIF